MTRHQSDPAVEADVVDSPGHRFQADGGGSMPAQPLDAAPHHCRSNTFALAVRANGQRSHPSFGAGTMNHVERHHLAIYVAPDHRSVTGILQRVAPNQSIE